MNNSDILFMIYEILMEDSEKQSQLEALEGRHTHLILAARN